MFDRENRREKILEARNREIRLKQKTARQPEPGEEGEGEGVAETEETGEDVFVDNYVKQAETEFYQYIKAATAPPKPVEEEEEEEEENIFPDPSSDQVMEGAK